MTEPGHRIDDKLLAPLAEHRLLPVLTVAGAEPGRRLAEALQAGGLPLAEVTLRVDGAVEALAAMVHTGITAGAGTVVTVDQVDQVADAGAAFVVSPGLSAAVVHRCRERGLPVLPGVATPSDLMQAVALGLTTVKLFPAHLLGGPEGVRALSAPFGTVGFVPTGGVTPAVLPAYLALSSVLAVGGSWLAPRGVVAAGDWTAVEELTRAAVREVDEVLGR